MQAHGTPNFLLKIPSYTLGGVSCFFPLITSLTWGAQSLPPSSCQQVTPIITLVTGGPKGLVEVKTSKCFILFRDVHLILVVYEEVKANMILWNGYGDLWL